MPGPGKCIDAQSLLFGPGGLLFVPINNAGEVRRYDTTTGAYEVCYSAGGKLISA